MDAMFADFRSLRDTTSPENGGRDKNKDRDVIDLFQCPYCQESTLSEEDGEYVCTACGRESGVVITTQQEWRNHMDSSKTGDPSRCGMPVHPLLPQASLGTVAQGYGKQGFRRLQMQSAMPSNERSLLDAIKIIKEAALKLNVPGTLADKACYLYSELTKNMKIKRGPVRKALMASCQYAICKKYKCYICREEMVAQYGIPMKKYNEGAKLFFNLSYHKTHGRAKETKWGSNFSSSREEFVKPTNPESITEDACKRLDLSDIETAEVTYVVRQVSRFKVVSSRMPQSIAAGCLIFYQTERGYPVNISKISKICVVSNATAKNTFLEIKNYSRLSKGRSFLLPKTTDDLVNGKVGNCMPKIQLEKIYTAPKRALPKTVILPSSVTNVVSNRGRPKKVLD